jgi:hypothetical protein
MSQVTIVSTQIHAHRVVQLCITSTLRTLITFSAVQVVSALYRHVHHRHIGTDKCALSSTIEL